MAITIYDIAERAKLSHTTVSMALRDMPQVKEATRKRIRKLADEMGYYPNLAAISLTSGRSHRIALIVPQASLPLSHVLIEHLDHLCSLDGYEMVLMQLTLDPQRNRRIFEGLLQGGYDAAATYLYDYASVRDLVDSFVDQKKPMVLVGVPQDFVSRPGFFPVQIDNYNAVRDGMKMLMALGHRYIAHTIQPEQLSRSISHQVIRDALKANGVTDWEPEFFYPNLWPNYSVRSGYHAAEALLKNKPETTAIQCMNDMFACGLIRGLQEHGVRVPQDISVIGSDNTELGELFPVAISTIDMRLSDTAMLIWQLLSTQLQRQDWETIPDMVTLRGNLIIRESTGIVRNHNLNLSINHHK